MKVIAILSDEKYAEPDLRGNQNALSCKHAGCARNCSIPGKLATQHIGCNG